jgi:regulator of ribonuclease activity A
LSTGSGIAAINASSPVACALERRGASIATPQCTFCVGFGRGKGRTVWRWHDGSATMGSSRHKEPSMTQTTPDLCDAFPDNVQVATPIFRAFGGRDFFGGRIVTIRCFEDNSKVKEQVALSGQGKVLVVDGGGSLRRALLGDQLAEQAVANGWEGILINGCLRDVQIIASLDLGVQALASHPMKTEKRGLGDVDVPVTFAGLTFVPGSWIYADANGVVVSSKMLTAG